MAVCVKPFHNKMDKAIWLTEFIEMYRIQGAEHFIFYNHTVGPNVQKVLNFYQKQNILTILNWNLPLISKKQIRTEAIFSAINDCNLRASGYFEYLAIVDLDEYILPSNETNLVTYLDKKNRDDKKYATFQFQNVFHYLYWENTTESMKEDWPSEELPYLLTQTKLRRTKNPHKHGVRSKYVTRPEKVKTVGNHGVWKMESGKLQTM